LEELGVLGPNKGQEGREVLIFSNGKLKENNTRKESVKKTKSTLKSSTNELDTLVGLASVKEEINTLSNFIKIQQKRKEQGLKSSSVSYHCVFTGNPGTGKTTVARIVAQIYKDLGILSKGHLVETDRSGLVAEYVGQTAVKTNKIIDSALDGVLFIDEAYSLIGTGQDYGKEAIATLLKRMEDNRDRLVVILAGYSKEMQDFINTNPGLQSRFNRYIDFPDYSAEELLQIFEKNVEKFDYKLQKEALVAMSEYFQHAVENKDANFGNARFVRNLFEKSIQNQAMRLSSQPNITEEILSILKSEDFPQ
jgi:stage V sporulation protein K